MVLGTGVDLVVIGRIGRLREKHGERFLNRIFTPAELEECLGRALPDQGLAARFAAKEAAMKALGTGLAQGVGWRDVEVGSTGGRPVLMLHGRAAELAKDMGVRNCALSLSHEREYAMAMVVMES